MELNIATAPRANSRHWRQDTVSWDEIITWMLDPADRKEAGGYILGTLRETEHHHDGKPCFALHRNRDAVVSRDALTLDVDDPCDDFLERVKDLKVKSLVHTTFNSTPDSPRYRVLIPLSRSVLPDEFEALTARTMELVGSSSFDEGSQEPERLMFMPAGEHFEFWVHDGPVMEPPAATESSEPLLPPAKQDPFSLPGAMGAFNRVYTDLDTLIEAYGLPYEAEGARWRYKGTHSAPGMVHFEERDGLWWSDHQTDPAHGRAQNAFDLMRIHLFRDADLTAKPDTPLWELPSSKKALELAEADEAVRRDQLEHEFGSASPLKKLGYDNDSVLDDDLARNLADRGLRDDFRYVDDRGWLRWDGTRWQDCSSLDLWDPVSEMIRTMAEEWFTMGKTNGQIRGLKSFHEVPKKKRLIENLRSILLISDSDLDTHPDYFNCANGTVDLRTGQLLPHSREHYLTKITPVPYVPGATHPDWDKVLSAIQADTVAWMQYRCGQAASGYPSQEDIIPILQGSGGNGKTAFVGALRDVFGEYATALAERAVLAREGDHPTELMDLKGARFAVMEELPEGRSMNMKRLKDVTGSATIKARRMRQDPEEFEATHALFLTTNYHPTITETDEGTWRRFALVVFPYDFRPGATGEFARTPDDGLKDRIRESRTGQHEAALAWVLDGAVRWYQSGRARVPFPPSVVEETRQWRASYDPIHQYLEDRLEESPAHAITVKDLYEDFSDWMDENGWSPWRDKTFTGRFRDHERAKSLGVASDRMTLSSKKCPYTASLPDPLAEPPQGQVRVWTGIRFKEEL